MMESLSYGGELLPLQDQEILFNHDPRSVLPLHINYFTRISYFGAKMGTTLQPIKLYFLASGPNPWKVAIIMEELGIEYQPMLEDMISVKEEKYQKLNPNGR